MSPLRRGLVGLVVITRPGNVLLTAVSVAVGGVCAEARWGSPLVLACLSAALIAAGGYVVNDLFDLEVDRINRPGRPLPRGDLSLRQAGVWAITLLGAGPLLAWTLGRATGLTATGVAVGLVLYAAYLKRTAFVGHVLVAVMSGTAFAYGGMVGPRTDTSLVPAILAGAFHLGREMFKAAADWLGDRRGGLRTMAVRWGVKNTCRLAIVPLAVVVVLSPLPTVWGWFGSFYLITVTVGVDTVLLYVMYRAWQSPDMKTAQRLADLLKWDMVAGLVAVGGDRWLDWLPLIGR